MRWLPLSLVLFLPLAVVGCDGNEPAGQQPARPGADSSASATASVAALSKAGCEVRPSPENDGPVLDPNGPYYHQVVVANSTDGVTVTGAHQVLEHASVPDGVKLADGRVFIYYINAEKHGINVAQVAGDGVQQLGPIALDGVSRPLGIVDPDATLMPDGKVRLAYLSNFNTVPRVESVICLADSSDGINFSVLGRAIAFKDLTTDPSLARLADGTWLMAASQGQKTALARSSDGLSFESYATVTYGGVPEVTALADGRVRLYVCTGGIESYVSTDKGTTWTREGTVVRGTPQKRLACDPSVVSGAGLFVYKWAD
jgi:hypothetical protein